MLMGVLTYTPNAGNAAVCQFVFSAGNGLPPGYPRYGSAQPPAGFEIVICAPHGGLFANRVLKNRCGVSEKSPHAPRTLVRPSLPGVQIAPTLGVNCPTFPCVVESPG